MPATKDNKFDATVRTVSQKVSYLSNNRKRKQKMSADKRQANRVQGGWAGNADRGGRGGGRGGRGNFRNDDRGSDWNGGRGNDIRGRGNFRNDDRGGDWNGVRGNGFRGRGCERRSFPEDRTQAFRCQPGRRSLDTQLSERRMESQVACGQPGRRSLGTDFSENPLGRRMEYQPTNYVARKKPPPIIYLDNKPLRNEVISREPNGESIIRYYPELLSQEFADEALATLLAEEQWEDHHGISHGEQFRMPRQMVWYGPIPYSFSGTTLPQREKFSNIIASIHDIVSKAANCEFNSVLLNLYRNEHDSVDWHSDDEHLFGACPTIASVSLGETRNFELRKKPISRDETFEYSQHISIPLVHGSLLTMEGAVQLDWQHRLKKEFHSRGQRINLTFRQCTYTLDRQENPSSMRQ